MKIIICLSLLLVFGCESKGSQESFGGFKQPCYGDKTCDEPFVCISGICLEELGDGETFDDLNDLEVNDNEANDVNIVEASDSNDCYIDSEGDDIEEESMVDNDLETHDEDPTVDTPYCINEECLVPEGAYMMGCRNETIVGCNKDQFPYHKAVLSEFWIDQYEVTIEQFKRCVDAGVCNNDTDLQYVEHDENQAQLCNFGTNFESLPMNCISWYGAKEYCNWIGKRLPTEAEWEKASRGTDERNYPWGDDKATCNYAVMSVEIGKEGCETGRTWPVGSKPLGISPYGLLDMGGNVMEWVFDGYKDDFYADSPLKNPVFSEDVDERSIRGGSFTSAPVYLMTSARDHDSKSSILFDVGFRCAR